jgi:hypothetical protein
MGDPQHILSFSTPGRRSIEISIGRQKKQIFDNGQPSNLRVQGEFEPANPEDLQSVQIFEWQPLHILALIGASEKDQDKTYKLYINQRLVKESRYSAAQEQHIISESVTFKNQVGDSHISLRSADGDVLFDMHFEVFPQKMDFRSDYSEMMREIRDIVHNLAFAMLKDTYQQTKPNITGQTTESEWLSILQALFEAMEKSLSVIQRQPQHQIERVVKRRPVDKVKRAGPSEIKWLSKSARFARKANGDHGGIEVAHGKTFQEIQTTRKRVSYDTPENQFVRWAIEQTLTKLIHIEKELFKPDEKEYGLFKKKLQGYQGRLQSILHQHPFTDVSPFTHRQSFSTAMTRGSGYRDFLQIYLILIRGLDIAESDIFKNDVKQISELYEYWCYLKIIKLITEQKDLTIDLRDLIKIKSGRFSVSLQKGKKSEVTFTDEQSGDTISAFYNREFQKTKHKPITYSQLPDYTLKFDKAGFKTPFWYLFDAKYRFDEESDEDNSSYNVPKDAIGQLHRYRDAILHSEPTQSEYLTYKSAIKNLGGVILYPYPKAEEKFKQNSFYRSIEEVNIGALPLLPGKSKLAATFLDNLLNETPEGHYEKIIDMDRSEYYEEREKWSDTITLVIMPKKNQKERIRFLLEEKLVYVPRVKKPHSKLFLTSELLVVIAGEKLAYRCRVTEDGYRLYSRDELRKLGTTWSHREREYIGFHVDIEETKIELPSVIHVPNFRYATRRGLDMYLETGDSSYFYVTNADCARLIKELKSQNVSFNINWVNQPEDPTKVEILVEYILSIYSSERYKNLHFAYEKRVGAEQVGLGGVMDILKQI